MKMHNRHYSTLKHYQILNQKKIKKYNNNKSNHNNLIEGKNNKNKIRILLKFLTKEMFLAIYLKIIIKSKKNLFY